MAISKATPNDIPALVRLLNKAYRGESSRKGWTTEADIIEGDERTDEKNLLELMQQPFSTFLKYQDETDNLVGSVFVQKQNNTLYLGMLSVEPALQAKGIGRELMDYAGIFALGSGCDSITIKVISVRKELIAWYERKGFFPTGETEPFPVSAFGKSKIQLEFLVMKKTLH